MAERQANEKPTSDSQGEVTSPTTSTVMADTGALTRVGVYEVLGVVCAEASAQFQLEHRNAANDGNEDDVVAVYCPANSTVPFLWKFSINNRNERVRIMMQQNLTGVAVASLNVQRVG